MAWIRIVKQTRLCSSSSGRESGDRGATDVYFCYSDVPTTAVAAESASSTKFGTLKHDISTLAIPKVNTPHPDDKGRLVTRVRAESLGELSTAWSVTVEYSSRPSGTVESTDPLKRKPLVLWTNNREKETYGLDRSTPIPKPVVNTAGVPFEEPPERDTHYLTATYRRNFPVTHYNPDTADEYQDTINSDVLTLGRWTIPAGKAKLSDWKVGEPQTENGIEFVTEEFEFEFRRNGWDESALSLGYMARPSTGATAIPIKPANTTDGNDQTATLWPLDDNGLKKTNQSDPASVIVFKPYALKALMPLLS